jgi:hypothetical protein
MHLRQRTFNGAKVLCASSFFSFLFFSVLLFSAHLLRRDYLLAVVSFFLKSTALP